MQIFWARFIFGIVIFIAIRWLMKFVSIKWDTIKQSAHFLVVYEKQKKREVWIRHRRLDNTNCTKPFDIRAKPDEMLFCCKLIKREELRQNIECANAMFFFSFIFLINCNVYWLNEWNTCDMHLNNSNNNKNN